MQRSLTTLVLGAALLLAVDVHGEAGDFAVRSGERLPMSPIAYAPTDESGTTRKAPSGVQVAAGAECPTGSGSYCSDELPYCCPGVNVDPYCAENLNGCTK